MNSDALMKAVAQWKLRAADANMTGALCVVTTAPGSGIHQIVKVHNCPRCARKKFASIGAAVAHVQSIPHIAAEAGCSPFDLARAIRGTRMIAGDDPTPRRKRRRAKWNKNRTGEAAVMYAEQMAAKWKKRRDAADRKVRLWTRRMKQEIKGD